MTNPRTLAEQARSEDLARKLAAAKEAAVVAPTQADESPDWPPVGEMSDTEIMVQLEIAMYQTGMKVSLALTPDSRGIWARASFPKWSPDKYRAGKVCFMAAGGCMAALEKLVKALEIESEKVWKPDQYAR